MRTLARSRDRTLVQRRAPCRPEVTRAVLPYDPAIDIEEHELHYSPEAPLRAWRLFRVRPWVDGFVLSSPMCHDPEPPPWPQVGSEASCYEEHAAPAAGCRCGIYAAVEGTLDSLPGYLLDTAYERDPWTYAEVACAGRVFVDMRGVRAERARVLRIALPETGWPDQQAFEVARRLLRERYRVPVSGLEEVPAWSKTTAATRGRRPRKWRSISISTDLISGYRSPSRSASATRSSRSVKRHFRTLAHLGETAPDRHIPDRRTTLLARTPQARARSSRLA